MKAQATTVKDLLWNFAHQRPGLDFSNYGDFRAYRRESAEITRDLHDFRELYNLACRFVDDLDGKLTQVLKSAGGRLALNEAGELEYCTGQYFPTEYRPAASRVLCGLIWNAFGEDYQTAGEIRKAIRRNVSRRVAKFYFS